jgi:hypothetical protein
MILPDNETDLANAVRSLINRCMSTQLERCRLYQWREKYYLFGTSGYEQAKYNKIESHIDLVTSFLYSPAHAFYHISSDDIDNDLHIRQATALQDDFDDDFQMSGISDAISHAIQWSIVYDTMLIKQGWNRDREQWFAELVPPHNFGVYRESVTDLDSQQAFCHEYFLDYQTAKATVENTAKKDTEKKDDVERLAVVRTDSVSPFPEMLQRMIIAGTGGSNLSGTVFGQANPDYTPSASYQPKSEVPLVKCSELWVWDDTHKDYRMFQMMDPDILVLDTAKKMRAWTNASRNVTWLFDNLEKIGKSPSTSNDFFPREHPFAVIQPYRKYNYFWGKAHIDSLIPLQEWMLERLDQIDDILSRQADPAKVGSGFMGLTEQKMAAFGGAGTSVWDSLPTAKVEELKPDMPPDIFAEKREIDAMFLEASGLTEVMSGRSEQGVRSRQHASELKQTGSGRIKKAALMIETPLVKIGDVGLKLKQANDDKKLTVPPGDDGKPHHFLACDVKGVKMRVDGHSHSPLFGEESRELAVMLRKFGALDNEDLIRGTNPPARDTLLHNLRRRERKKQQMMQQHPELLGKAMGGGGGGAKKK